MKVSIGALLTSQLVLVLALVIGVFFYAILVEERSISESVVHGEAAVATCFDEYLLSIENTGVAFITDISLQLKGRVKHIVDHAEASARSAATAVERTRFMENMETNSWHGTRMLPSFGWMILSPLGKKVEDEEDGVVADIVVATLNSTEEFNNWVWFGLPSRNPNPSLDCEFYYYRNATNSSSSLWCLEDLFENPDMPSPSIFPHRYSPAIVKLQEATPCDMDDSLVWMPLNFFVSTLNVVSLTSVVSAIHGPDGSCQGLAAANVRFTSMAKYLDSLVESSRYANLSIALIETTSETILGTSLGSAIYYENQTNPEGNIVEQELAANLGQMNHPLATALNLYIEENYGSISQIPTPVISPATLQDEDFLLSFDTFSQPMLNLTVCVFLPVASITGPIEAQRVVTYINYEESAEIMEENMNARRILAVSIGVACFLVCVITVALSSIYISSRVGALVNYMEELRSKISKLVDKDKAVTSTTALCEPLPPDFFPAFNSTHLKDLNKISASTEDLCLQLLETWNAKQEVFRRALEQRQFTASIAHDIRNPVHGVLGIVSMMQSDIELHKDKLPLLGETLTHMSNLLNDMVDLSKIQGGKATHDAKEFDAYDTLHEIVTLYQSKIASTGGTLSCSDHTNELPLAYSDPVHVQRILSNFVSNASKYAPGAPVLLTAIAATRQQVQSRSFLPRLHLNSKLSDDAPYWAENGSLEDDHYIVFACLDEGQGIPHSKLDRVFDAYQQARSSDKYQGSGLGLAIVKGLAMEMGGGVGVQSEERRGSLFWLVVPSTSRTARGRPPLVESSLSEFSQSAKPFNKCHILIVDDTNLNLMLLNHFLTKLHVTSDMASSAADGLVLLQENPKKYSMIISDFDMPGMTGGQFCQEIRKDHRLCHIPFICVSGSQITSKEEEIYQIDESMMKPFSAKKLQEIIARHLNGPSKWILLCDSTDGTRDLSEVSL